MIYGKPLPFDEARDAINRRQILRTTLDSRQLNKLPAYFRERGLFSSRVSNADWLQTVDDDLKAIIGGTQDQATARWNLKRNAEALLPAPSDEDAGTIKDPRSDRRSMLILDMNTRFAQGRGQWEQGQAEGVIDQWPAQELYRLYKRQQPRDWSKRWLDNLDRNSEPVKVYGATRRMIALKNDPIWIKISRFGLPYPPFDYGSGMGLRPVDRPTAVALGLLTMKQKVAPMREPLPGVELPTNAGGDLLGALLKGLDFVKMINGVLRWRPN